MLFTFCNLLLIRLANKCSAIANRQRYQTIGDRVLPVKMLAIAAVVFVTRRLLYNMQPKNARGSALMWRRPVSVVPYFFFRLIAKRHQLKAEAGQNVQTAAAAVAAKEGLAPF